MKFSKSLKHEIYLTCNFSNRFSKKVYSKLNAYNRSVLPDEVIILHFKVHPTRVLIWQNQQNVFIGIYAKTGEVGGNS